MKETNQNIVTIDKGRMINNGKKNRKRKFKKTAIQIHRLSQTKITPRDQWSAE